MKTFRIGERVIVTPRDSSRYGQQGTVIGHAPGGWLFVRFPDHTPNVCCPQDPLTLRRAPSGRKGRSRHADT
jgi:hypothetical protein